jgi:hypothetical protein
MPVVLTLFPDITVNVAKAKLIGNPKLIDRSRFPSIFSLRAIAIDVCGIVIGEFWRDGLAKVKGCGGTSTAGIFPLCFAGETIGATCVECSGPTKLDRVISSELPTMIGVVHEQ